VATTQYMPPVLRLADRWHSIAHDQLGATNRDAARSGEPAARPPPAGQRAAGPAVSVRICAISVQDENCGKSTIDRSAAGAVRVRDGRNRASADDRSCGWGASGAHDRNGDDAMTGTAAFGTG
jgi:hypothetical protein